MFHCQVHNINFKFSSRTERIIAGSRAGQGPPKAPSVPAKIKMPLPQRLVSVVPLPEFSAALITTFYSLLRTSELLNHHWKDIKLSQRLIFISKSKLDKYNTGVDVRMLKPVHQVLPQLATLRPANADPADRVFNFATSDLNSTLKSCLAQLGVKSRYTWHCLRHGGATTMHDLGFSIQGILIHGRWKDILSCHRYTHQADEDEYWE
eukprot:GEZU01027210.1.p1 GENE.GEZU01027210.1~~GEZU01027210.1.p1  ORF type:complete len:207 (-),score=36.72 GEZU01027210.1:369-989(-)